MVLSAVRNIPEDSRFDHQAIVLRAPHTGAASSRIAPAAVTRLLCLAAGTFAGTPADHSFRAR